VNKQARITARQKHELTETEYGDFRRLPPFEGFAWKFWRRVAEARGLDYTTLLTNGRSFTGLPVGHEQHWCAPLKLQCLKKPPAEERV
jgi:hypothetical protein